VRGCAWCGKRHKLESLELCRWCFDRFKWEEWHRGLPSRTDVNMLPVEGDTGLGYRPTPSPSQPVDEGHAPPRGLEEVRRHCS